MEVGCSIYGLLYVTCIDYNISIKNHIVIFDRNGDNFNGTFEIMASNKMSLTLYCVLIFRSKVILNFVIVFCLRMLKKIMRSSISIF